MEWIGAKLTNALYPGQYENLSTNLPTRDDLRFGEVDLEEPPISFVPPFYPVVSLLIRHNTLTLDCHPDQSVPLSEPVRQDSDALIDESSVAPGPMQFSPRNLTRSQG